MILSNQVLFGQHYPSTVWSFAHYFIDKPLHSPPSPPDTNQTLKTKVEEVTARRWRYNLHY